MNSDPNVEVAITPSSEGHLSVGNQFNVSCVALDFDLLDHGFDVQWRKLSGVLTNFSQTNDSLFISSVRLSDAGEYMCEVIVTSDYLVNGYAKGMGNYSLGVTSKFNSSNLFLYQGHSS